MGAILKAMNPLRPKPEPLEGLGLGHRRFTGWGPLVISRVIRALNGYKDPKLGYKSLNYS